MAEQTFLSPGFFEQEIELIAGAAGPQGTPAGLIGPAEKGPAFVPVTVGNFTDFTSKFGGLDPDIAAPYAAREWLKHKGALTYIRTLGAGANSSLADIADTLANGTVKNAGFKITPGNPTDPANAAVASLTHVSVTPADYNTGEYTIVSTDGTTRNYAFDDTGTNPTGTDLGSNRIVVQVQGLSSVTTIATETKNAIEGATGHNGKITVAIALGVLTLTQSTAGDAGNTTITPVSALASSVFTKTNFSGGDNVGHPWTDSSVQFIVAQHYISASSPSAENGLPIFTDNPSFDVSYGGSTQVDLVRAVTFAASGSRVQVMPFAGTYSSTMDDTAYISDEDSSSPSTSRKFKIVISSSNADFATNVTDGFVGVRILTASLDPNDDAYISKVLNTDPDLFSEKKHLLYLDFSVDQEVSPVRKSGTTETIGILSGSGAFNTKFGRYDTRYTTPRTTAFISQPFGKMEYDLFHFETISDGAWGNDKVKISVANVNASTDKSNPYGTFDIQVRRFLDDDIQAEIVEAYPGLSLNPKADNYIARVIGDKKVYYNFDADDGDERRLVITGKYPNRSPSIRVVMNPAVETGEVPSDALPFGFHGIPALKTNDSLFDGGGNLTFDGKTFVAGTRLHGRGATTDMKRSLIPPLPLRFKVTRGEMSTTDGNIGSPGVNERADSRFYWGVMGTSVPLTGSVSNAILNANLGVMQNPIVAAYTKFQGIAQQDVLVTGSAADVLNANKFTLARVALSNQTFTDVTGTSDAHMREAAYVRDGINDASDYRIVYGSATNRVTMATLIHSSSVVFNRFTPYMKFTNIFYGGFDGLNILDKDNRLMNDRASSTETSSTANGGNGKALGAVEAGLQTNAAGIGNDNNIVASYKAAVDIMTDEFTTNVNVFAIPGIRDALVSNYAADKARNNSLAMYVMDIPSYDDNGYRLWDGTTTKPSVRYTSETFIGRAIDNNYAATYFPDVQVNDEVNGRRVIVPSSVAALGAMAFNDKVTYPWFAPAGFNRGALDFVANVKVRLNSGDRDTLYSGRINPIAVFPTGGFVIFGQKTLQLAKSALDRVNVRRLMIEVKRTVTDIANGILFEQNTPATRARFVNQVTPRLALIQAQAGIEKFRVIMDDTNNTQTDVENNRVNGRIVVVPTRAVEFISIDFVITNSGVQFE